jgi:ureidoglycolate hydrolase
MVAILNWEPSASPEAVTHMERHVATDEAFVLLSGGAMLLTRVEGGEVAFTDLEPKTIYNVPRGVWHALVATRDSSLLIVEDRDTHLRDTEIRALDGAELSATEREREHLMRFEARI